MPVRSLNSSVLKWPDAQTVEQSLRRWTEKVVRRRTDVVRIGYFGSYARGDWGVGSDLDLIIIVAHSGQPFTRRSVEWDTTELPVPTDVLVYTEEEWRSMSQRRRQMSKQVVNWVYQRRPT
ncbi:MAG: nucleotidyltransferase domain-containing protein [Chloroflexota bacterium]|nr:nucleotidyltransferase domain-containing protein [Chloroflexota bacterium]